MDMSDDELVLFEKLMIRLLPPAPHTRLGKTQIIVALREMHRELKPRINHILRDIIKRSSRSSWQSLVKDAAKAVVEEMDYVCSICHVKLNDRNMGTELVSMSCCKHVFHRKCFAEWTSHGGRLCPMCLTSIPREKLVALGVVQPEARPSDNWLQQIREEQRALIRERQNAAAERILAEAAARREQQSQRAEAASRRIMANADGQELGLDNPRLLVVVIFTLVVALVLEDLLE